MKLIIQPEAQEEIENALDHSTQPIDFQVAINNIWSTIMSQPEIAPRVVRSKCRRYVMPKYPYSAIYFVEDDRVIVVAFPHHRQRSGYWRRRAIQN